MGFEFALPRGFYQLVVDPVPGAVQLFPEGIVPEDCDLALIQIGYGTVAWRDDPDAEDELNAGTGMIAGSDTNEWLGGSGQYNAPFDTLYITYIEGNPVIRVSFYKRST